MFKHYLTTAWHHFRRNRLTTAINVVSLALGLACFVAAYGAVTYFTNGDRQFANASRIYAVTQRMFDTAQHFDSGFRLAGSLGIAKYLPVDVPQLSAVAAYSAMPLRSIHAGDRTLFVDAAWADPDLLRIFDFPMQSAAASNPLLRPREVILTEQTATRLFGTTQVLGRTLRIENALDVTVGAVMKTLPQSSHFGKPGAFEFGEISELNNFDLLISRATYLDLQRELKNPLPSSEWFSYGTTYVLLPADGSIDAAMLDARLKNIARNHGMREYAEQNEFRALPVNKARLNALERTAFRNSSGASLVAIAMSIAGLVLAIAWVNYANLTIAQILRRAKDAGMRRVLGAGKVQLMAQYVTEAVLQTMLATIIAVGLVAALGFIVSARADLDLFGAVAGSTRFWLIVALTAAGTAIAVGLYPAFVLTRLRPAQTIGTGKIMQGSHGASRAIVGVQFLISSALMIALIVAYAQNFKLRGTGPGEADDPVVVLGIGWNSRGASIEAWRGELLTLPGIKSVSAAMTLPWSESWAAARLVPNPDAAPVPTIANPVYYDFQNALEMKVLAGRAFDAAIDDLVPASTDASFFEGFAPGIVIDRTMMRELGFSTPQAAVNRIVYRPQGDALPPTPVRILGVVENKSQRLVPVFGRTANIYTLMRSPANWQGARGGGLLVRVSRDALPATLDHIDQVWRRLSDAPVKRRFIDEYFEHAYAAYARVGIVFSATTCVGCLIAALGLLGIAMFVAGQRAHEVGVRKTFGAHSGQIVAMLLRDFSKPVVIANLLGWPLAYVAARFYLNLFIQRTQLTPWPFVLSLGITLLIAWLAVAGQAWNAARVKPALVLRHE